MKFISTIFLLFGLLLSDSAFAQPGGIGYDDCLHKLQDLELKGPEGEELFLGYRTTITWFVFGIYLKDQGYILAVKGNRTEGACVGNEEGQYYDLNEDEITRLQSEGSLPIPLPNYDIDVLFYAIGYSLWLIIAGIAGFSGLKRVFKKNPFQMTRLPNKRLTAASESRISDQLNVRSVPIEPIDETRLILRPTLAKKVVFFAGSALFVFVGVWMIRDGKPGLWFPTIFFGLCSIVFLIQLHPRASSLILTSEGFEVRALFRSNNYLWQDVSNFFVKRIALNSMVFFNFVDDYEPQSHKRKLSSAVAGAETALPDTYGKKPEELLSILNAWKDRAKRST